MKKKKKKEEKYVSRGTKEAQAKNLSYLIIVFPFGFIRNRIFTNLRNIQIVIRNKMKKHDNFTFSLN